MMHISLFLFVCNKEVPYKHLQGLIKPHSLPLLGEGIHRIDFYYGQSNLPFFLIWFSSVSGMLFAPVLGRRSKDEQIRHFSANAPPPENLMKQNCHGFFFACSCEVGEVCSKTEKRLKKSSFMTRAEMENKGEGFKSIQIESMT